MPRTDPDRPDPDRPDPDPVDSSDSVAFELGILGSLRRIIRAIDLYSKRIGAAHGVTVPQLVCLTTIAAEGSLTLSELSRRVHVSASTAVGIVDRLERRGLVTRRRETVDRRRVRVELTPAGAALVADAPSPLQDRLSGGLRELSQVERASIALSLERLVELMEAGDLEAAPILQTGPITPADPDAAP